jgi:hypothetical protein
MPQFDESLLFSRISHLRHQIFKSGDIPNTFSNLFFILANEKKGKQKNAHDLTRFSTMERHDLNFNSQCASIVYSQ